MRLIIISLLLSIGLCGQCQSTDYLAQLKTAMGERKDTALVKVLLSIGHFFIEQNNYDSCRFYYKKAFELSQALAYKRGIVMALGDLGIADYRTARYATAMDYYQQALKAALNVKSKRDVAVITGNIGELNVVLGNRELGIEQLKTSEKELVILKDTLSLISLQLQLAQIYGSFRDTANTSFYLTKAMTIVKAKLTSPGLTAQNKITLQGFQRSILYSQSNLLREDNELGAAITILKQLAEEMKDIPSGREKIGYEFNIAETYFEMHQYQQALQYCNQTLALLKKDSIPDIYSFTYELRSDIYAAMGQTDSALRDFKLAKQIDDSIFSRTMMNKTAVILAAQETERKNEEITYLNREKKMYRLLIGIAVVGALAAGIALVLVYRSRKLQRKLMVQENTIILNEKELENNKLQIQLFEQEQAALRAQMNPHFIFNSLNSIQHYVIDRDIQGANRYISMLGSLIRLTLDYAAKPAILLKEELDYLEKYLGLEKMRMQDAFDYHITVAEGINTEEHEVPPMLLQPFLENALKHGVAYLQNKQGRITLLIEQVGDAMQYTITDNGVGRAVTSQYNKGFGKEVHESKGIALSEKRIAQFKKGGVVPSLTIIDLQDEHDTPIGTQVVIVLPA